MERIRNLTDKTNRFTLYFFVFLTLINTYDFYFLLRRLALIYTDCFLLQSFLFIFEHLCLPREIDISQGESVVNFSPCFLRAQTCLPVGRELNLLCVLCGLSYSFILFLTLTIIIARHPPSFFHACRVFFYFSPSSFLFPSLYQYQVSHICRKAL